MVVSSHLISRCFCFWSNDTVLRVPDPWEYPSGLSFDPNTHYCFGVADSRLRDSACVWGGGSIGAGSWRLGSPVGRSRPKHWELGPEGRGWVRGTGVCVRGGRICGKKGNCREETAWG